MPAVAPHGVAHGERHRGPRATAVFFGPSASLAHLALVVELQRRGIETWAWRPKGKALPDTVTTGRGSEGGEWLELPTVERMVKG